MHIIRFIGWAVFVLFVLLANAGVAGAIGIGSPFMPPLLWCVARNAGPLVNAICIGLAGLTGTILGYLLAGTLGLETDPFVTPLLGGCVTVAFFVLTTTRPIGAGAQRHPAG